jgi:hypothetical protein
VDRRACTVERLGDYLERAQAGHRAGQPEITWEQFVRLYHQRQQQLAAEREAADEDHAKPPRPN